MLSVVIEAFEKSVMFLCNVLYNSVCKWLFGHDSTTGLHITLHSSPTRLDGIHPVQIHLIGIRHSPDHRRVRHKGVKFIWIYSLVPDLVSVVRIRESPYYRGSFKRKYMRILSGHWKLSVIERCPYREVRLYLQTTYGKNSIKQSRFHVPVWKVNDVKQFTVLAFPWQVRNRIYGKKMDFNTGALHIICDIKKIIFFFRRTR